MPLGFLQHFVVRRGFVFVIVRLDVILAHGMGRELVPHQDAAQVGMTIEYDAVEIENLALLEFAAAPYRCERGQMSART